jgi:hypothetical protein
VHLSCEQDLSWPLAWVAECGAKEVRLHHGAMVEAAEGSWAVEGAWGAPFADGDIDRAAIVSGSGVRVRDGRAMFVSPTSTIDRLCSISTGGLTLVSNSLLVLLRFANARVIDRRYRRKVASIAKGLEERAGGIKTSAGRVRLTYFNNLAWNGTRLRETEKPRHGAELRSFAGYRELLAEGFDRLAENMAAPERATPLTFLGTLSSGYDANAATLLASEAGCKQALCFETTGRCHPDSGLPIAEVLGIKPLVLEREAWRDLSAPGRLLEVPFLAVGQGSGLIGFGAAHGQLRGRVLVTGFSGDSIWNPAWTALSQDIVRKDASGLAFTEYRLLAGFVNCAPAFWAAREIADVVRISNSGEMDEWNGGSRYERPIPRRLLEEAGVPGHLFGQAKMGVPKDQPERSQSFLSRAGRRDYFAWLRENRKELGLSWPVNQARDRASFASSSLQLRLHVRLGAVPWIRAGPGWKSRLRELQARRRHPSPLRGHLIAWALDRGSRGQPSRGSTPEPPNPSRPPRG